MRLRTYSGSEVVHLAKAFFYLRGALAHHRSASGRELVMLVGSLRIKPPSSRPPDLRLVGWALAAVGRFFDGGSNCLVQAVAAAKWLAREGVASELKLGVKPGGPDQLAAHAWLVAGGRIVTGANVVHDYIELRRTGLGEP